ncbi:MAG TPA: hypothetical protein VHK47_14225 [Polyangia bacterium]|jgi:hypothetical protein|nr:hypothetical protein [Polyangia bacterium]
MKQRKRAASAIFGGCLALSAMAGLGCGTSSAPKGRTWALSGTERLRAAEGRVNVYLDRDDNHVVELVFRDLAPAQQAFAGTSFYMIWLVPKGSKPQAIGCITPNEARGAMVTIRTPYEEFDVILTAEPVGNPSRPSKRLAFSTRIPSSV